MAIERLKFRCYRCNQLLGATPNKAGSVVTCPKCSAELLIPVPGLPASEAALAPAPAQTPALQRLGVRLDAPPRNEPASAPPPAPLPEATAAMAAVGTNPREPTPPGYFDEIAAVLPPDLIDLKPEDLRVEAEFFESLARQPQPPPVIREPAPWPPPASLAPSFASESFASPSFAPPFGETAGAPSPPAVTKSFLAETVDLAPKPVEMPVSPPVPARVDAPLVGTSIEIEHPPILPPGTEIRRIREVVLPASVVVSWSLFVLLGITLSFVAGLLMGHFLWTHH